MKIIDFLIKLLGGYRLIVGYFDDKRGSFVGSNVKVYPFSKHCMRFERFTIYFDNEGKVTIKENS